MKLHGVWNKRRCVNPGMSEADINLQAKMILEILTMPHNFFFHFQGLYFCCGVSSVNKTDPYWVLCIPEGWNSTLKKNVLIKAICFLKINFMIHPVQTQLFLNFIGILNSEWSNMLISCSGWPPGMEKCKLIFPFFMSRVAWKIKTNRTTSTVYVSHSLSYYG